MSMWWMEKFVRNNGGIRKMKHFIGTDPTTGKDKTVHTRFFNGKIVSYGESPLAKCIPDLIKMQQLKAIYRKKL